MVVRVEKDLAAVGSDDHLDVALRGQDALLTLRAS
jgi:hypothetical protein